MKWQPFIALPTVAAVVVSVQNPAIAASDTTEIIQESTKIFQEMMISTETQIAPDVLRRSQAIAIIPDITQAGFIVGARRGTGVMLTRNANGTWGNPAFINVTGGSFGLQFGAKSSDLVLVFPNQKSVDDVLNDGSIELGGNVTGTAVEEEGTVAEVLQDEDGSDPIYVYSRSRGLFGGAAFEGAELGFNDGLNRELYGRPIAASEIFTNSSLPTPRDIYPLKDSLSKAQR